MFVRAWIHCYRERGPGRCVEPVLCRKWHPRQKSHPLIEVFFLCGLKSKTGAESPSVPQPNLKAETTDLVGEQASSTAPTVGLGTGGSSNGVQSDDDNDLFSGFETHYPFRAFQ